MSCDFEPLLLGRGLSFEPLNRVECLKSCPQQKYDQVTDQSKHSRNNNCRPRTNGQQLTEKGKGEFPDSDVARRDLHDLTHPQDDAHQHRFGDANLYSDAMETEQDDGAMD